MEQNPISHKLVLSEREKLTVTGVKEVVHFDETTVCVDTVRGSLQVHGRELRLKNLSPQGGQLELSGTVEAVIYGETKEKTGFLSRLLG